MKRRRAPGCLRQQGQFTPLRRAQFSEAHQLIEFLLVPRLLGGPALRVQGEDEDATEPIGHQAVAMRERHVASSRPEHLEQGRWIHEEPGEGPVQIQVTRPFRM